MQPLRANDPTCFKTLYTSLREKADGMIRFPGRDAHSTSGRTNLYRLLLTADGEEILHRARTATHFLSEQNSDFENFRELLYLLPSFVGSGYYSFVRLALELLLGEREIPDPTRAAALWDRSLSILPDASAEALLSPMKAASIADVTPWVFPPADRLAGYESLSAYTDAFAGFVSSASALRVDLSALEFATPDPYHAENGFWAVRSGAPTDDDRKYLTSQIFRVTGEACKRAGIPLILDGTLREAATAEMLSYLRKQERLPRLLVTLPLTEGAAIDDRTKVLRRLSLLDAASGLVLTNLPSCSTVDLREGLRRSAMQYPLGKLCFLAEGSTALEMRVGYERFLRVLAAYLDDFVEGGEISPEKASDVGTSILTAEALFRA